MKVQALRYELLRVLRLSASRYRFVWGRKPNHPLIDTKASERYLHYLPYCNFSDLVFFILVIRDVLHSHTLKLPEL